MHAENEGFFVYQSVLFLILLSLEWLLVLGLYICSGPGCGLGISSICDLSFLTPCLQANVHAS